MTRNFRILAVSALALGMVPVMASAEQSNAREIALLQSAAISAQTAAQTALAAHPGTLAAIDFGDENGVGIFEAEIIAADGTEWKVQVDAMTGNIVAQGQASAMDDQDGDHGDGDGEQNDG